jgi:hypothetical protein
MLINNTLLLRSNILQGDMEKELGLPYSPLCDRNTTLIPQSQIGIYFTINKTIFNFPISCKLNKFLNFNELLLH